jgi:hypothetical protein
MYFCIPLACTPCMFQSRSQWVRSKAWICGRLSADIARSNPVGGMAVIVVCCQVEVSATSRPLIQRSPTDCGVSECDRETSQRRSKPTGAVEPWYIKMFQKTDIILNPKNRTNLASSCSLQQWCPNLFPTTIKRIASPAHRHRHADSQGLLSTSSSGVPRGRFGGFNPSPPKFRSFDKAQPNSQFPGKQCTSITI